MRRRFISLVLVLLYAATTPANVNGSSGPGSRSTSPAAPHIFADGFVERTVAIVVRNNNGHGEYSIGMNGVTMAKVIAAWEAEAAQVEAKSQTKNRIQIEDRQRIVGGSQGETKPTAESPSTSGQPPKKGPQTLEPNNPSAALPTDTNGKSKPMPAEPPPSDSQRANSNQEPTEPQDAPIPRELQQRFNELAIQRLSDSLELKVDGERVLIKEVKLGVAPRHPFNTKIEFSFELPPSKKIGFSFLDQNFAQYDGAVRLAIKATGAAMLQKSTVAPILIRADRIELAEMSPDQRQASCSFSATLLIPEQ